jgi:hypothetical protein
MCLANRRALCHDNWHGAGFELSAAPDHSNLELTNEV